MKGMESFMTDQLKILIVEDVATDAELVGRELRRAGIDHYMARVDTKADYVRSLAAFAPGIIISDFSMPHFDGLSALEIARERAPNTPFIFVSGTIGEEVAIEAIKRGATDYVLKTNMARLATAVRRALHDEEERAALRTAEAELRKTQERFELFMRHLPGAAFMKDREGYYRYVNSTWEKLTGKSVGEVVGRRDDQLWPDTAVSFQANDRRVIDHNEPIQVFESFPQGDGLHTYLVNKFPIPDAEGQPVLLGGVAVDFTDRLRAEEKVARLSRIHAFLSGINSAIVRIRDRQELLREACRIAIEHGGFKLAWTGLLDKATLDVKPMAWLGGTAAFVSRLRISAREDIWEGQGIVGRVIRSGKPVVVNDISSDPRMVRMQESIEHGFLAAISLPLQVEGETIGTLTLYAGQTGAFDLEETKLLADLAADISFALEHIEKQEKLDYLAYYDTLTALPNRTLFCDRVDQLARASADKGMAVLLLDLERFSIVSETLGRQAGDALLKLIGKRLSEAVPGGAVVARIGGDVFAVQLTEAGELTDVAHVLEDGIYHALSQPFAAEGEELRLSFKCGIAMYPGDGVDAETLLINAGAALNKTKESGDRYLFYAPRMNARVAEILSLENKLRIAIAEEQFVLHYQPKLSFATNRITGLEALIRWNSPELGLVPPYKFIPILEETGMIIDVGAWVLRQAVSDQRRWRMQGFDTPRVAVNISSLQLRRKGFVDEVLKVIADDNDNHAVAIDLEITESVIMHDIERYIAELKKLRMQGIGIEIDDFGTGYSSLSYIAKLPVTALKIDRSFVNDMANGDDGVSIVSTIISLAHSLNLTVVAEGVETEAQRDLLKTLKCDTLQGYLFSKPRPAAEIATMFGARG
jgi:diguanylate cyclase (GGDEF)-like protein/PAS domain S-box-containing protein